MVEFDKARKIMVDNQLRPSGITDLKILGAMGRIPRERFLSEKLHAIAYSDSAQKVWNSERFLAAPAIFAKLVQLAEISSSDVVLDVGCGSGYSVAVLAELASAVVGLEDNEDLVEKANATLADLDIGNAAILTGNLNEGVPSEAPFDVILVEGAVDKVPPALLKQLRNGGRLIAMVNSGATAVATINVKTNEDIAVVPSFNAKLPQLSAMTRQPDFAF